MLVNKIFAILIAVGLVFVIFALLLILLDITFGLLKIYRQEKNIYLKSISMGKKLNDFCGN